eukprot:2152549-Prymnesium_polylepis.1
MCAAPRRPPRAAPLQTARPMLRVRHAADPMIMAHNLTHDQMVFGLGDGIKAVGGLELLVCAAALGTAPPRLEPPPARSVPPPARSVLPPRPLRSEPMGRVRIPVRGSRSCVLLLRPPLARCAAVPVPRGRGPRAREWRQ